MTEPERATALERDDPNFARFYELLERDARLLVEREEAEAKDAKATG